MKKKNLETVRLELTEEQIKLLTPLFDYASEEHNQNRTGAIISQPIKRISSTFLNDAGCEIIFSFIEKEYAEKICDLILEAKKKK